MSDRYAVYATKDVPSPNPETTADLPKGTVVNVIVWDGKTDYDPGDDLAAVKSDTLQIGDTVP